MLNARRKELLLGIVPKGEFQVRFAGIVENSQTKVSPDLQKNSLVFAWEHFSKGVSPTDAHRRSGHDCNVLSKAYFADGFSHRCDLRLPKM